VFTYVLPSITIYSQMKTVNLLYPIIHIVENKTEVTFTLNLI